MQRPSVAGTGGVLKLSLLMKEYEQYNVVTKCNRETRCTFTYSGLPHLMVGESLPSTKCGINATILLGVIRMVAEGVHMVR